MYFSRDRNFVLQCITEGLVSAQSIVQEAASPLTFCLAFVRRVGCSGEFHV